MPKGRKGKIAVVGSNDEEKERKTKKAQFFKIMNFSRVVAPLERNLSHLMSNILAACDRLKNRVETRFIITKSSQSLNKQQLQRFVLLQVG